nr:ribosomal RNA processing protein 36 homolog [Ipomoea batatas]
MLSIPSEENVVTKGSQSSARDGDLEASCGANHDDLTPRLDENMIISSENLVDVDLRMSSGSTRDENLEASHSASHEDSYPRIVLSDTNLVDVDVQDDQILARGETMEAPRGDSNNGHVPDSQSIEVLSGSIPAFSSLMSAIQELVKTQSSQFQSLNESIAKWSIKELQVVINRLSNKIDELANTNDANKGEKRACKEQSQGRGDRDRRDRDNHDGRRSDGRNRTDRNIPREKFLALQDEKKQEQAQYQRSQNELIFEKMKEDERILKIQKDGQEKFEEMKKRIEDVERVGKHEHDTLKIRAINQIMGATGRSFYDGMTTPKLLCWWNRRIIEGKNLSQATLNYLLLRLRSKYADMIENMNVFEARKTINDMLDKNDADESERLEGRRK